MAGSGGSGGGVTMNLNPTTNKIDVQSGGAGGGFPAAGIGGGGAGGSSGNTVDSGAGFGNGTAESCDVSIGGVNGRSFTDLQRNTAAVGGAYYESYTAVANPNKYALGGGEYVEYKEYDILPENNGHLVLADRGENMIYAGTSVTADGGIRRRTNKTCSIRAN